MAEQKLEQQEQPKQSKKLYSVISVYHNDHRMFDSLELAKKYVDSLPRRREAEIYEMEATTVPYPVATVANAEVPRMKVVFIGDGGVGKTTFIKRHLTGEFSARYIATMGVEVTPLPFNTNKGPVILNIWDCAGQEKFAGHRTGYYDGAQAFVVMFDVTSKTSYANAEIWVREATEYCRSKGTSPLIILCGNKVDCQDRKVLPQNIRLHTILGCQYYDVSAKSNYNYDKPFLHIIRCAIGMDTHFTEA